MARIRRLSLQGIDAKLLERAAATLRALGHPDRLRIVEVLERSDSTVSEIQEEVGLPQVTVSQHLAKLRAHGIVAAARSGQNVIYSIVEPKVEHILKCIRKCDL